MHRIVIKQVKHGDWLVTLSKEKPDRDNQYYEVSVMWDGTEDVTLPEYNIAVTGIRSAVEIYDHADCTFAAIEIERWGIPF